MSEATRTYFFETAADFGKWLKKNHNRTPELLVGFYKTRSGRRSMSWPGSVGGPVLRLDRCRAQINRLKATTFASPCAAGCRHS